MKRTLSLLAVLTLVVAGNPVWAGTSASSGAAGTCRLPDLARLPAAQVPAAALALGLEVSPAFATDPPCPTAFSCASISSNCGTGSACSITTVGQCCTVGKTRVCCGVGTFVKVTCPCECTASPCPQLCTQSSGVSWDCQ